MAKKLTMMLVVGGMMVVLMPLMADTETIGGYTWTYRINSDTAEIYDVMPKLTGTVIIPSTLGGKPVTIISDYAFYACSGLANVAIPNSVMSIGESAFSDCSGLTDVTIPDSGTSIAWTAFDGCTNVANVTVPGWQCNIPFNAVTNLVISDSVTSIWGYAFSGCSGLTSVTIPDSVTSIGDYAFSDCSGLTSVTIPNSVTSIGYEAFSGCSGLMSATILDGVTSIGDYAFSDCSGLTSVTIPPSVTNIGKAAFSGCSGLTSVTIPDGVTSIGVWAFSWCSGLTSVAIPNSVTSFGDGTFRGCGGLLSISVGEGNSCYSSANGLLLSKDGTTLVMGVNGDVTIPDSVTSIGAYAFENCSGLTSVTIPDSVTSFGEGAFEGCSGLTNVTIPGGVTDVPSSVFCGCTNLREVIIMEGVASIGREAFGCCFNLDKLVLPNSITGIEAEYVPDGDVWITYPVLSASGVTMYGCRSKGNSPFSCCTNLVDVTLPAYVCSTNLAVIFPDSWQSITNVVVCDGVTSVPNGLFWNCTGLQSVTIPSSVTRLGSSIDFYNMSGNMHGVFEDCASLKSITFMGDAPDMGDDVFLGTPRSLVTYVQPGSIGWDGGVSVDLPASWNGRGIAYVDTAGGSSTGGGAVVVQSDMRYGLSDAAADRTIASLTISSDSAIGDFVLKDGKVYDSVLHIANTATTPVRLIMPTGHRYVTVSGLAPLLIPASSTNLVTITRIAEDTFLVTRQNLEDIK